MLSGRTDPAVLYPGGEGEPAVMSQHKATATLRLRCAMMSCHIPTANLHQGGTAVLRPYRDVATHSRGNRAISRCFIASMCSVTAAVRAYSVGTMTTLHCTSARYIVLPAGAAPLGAAVS